MSAERLRLARLGQAAELLEVNSRQSHRYQRFLAQAGISISPFLWSLLVLGLSALLPLALSRDLITAALVSAGLLFYGFYLFPKGRANNRRARALVHLPHLLELVLESLDRRVELHQLIPRIQDQLPYGILRDELAQLRSIEDLEEKFSGIEMRALVASWRLFGNQHIQLVEALESLSVKLQKMSDDHRRNSLRLQGLRQTLAVGTTTFIVVPLVAWVVDGPLCLELFASSRGVVQGMLAVQALCLLLLKYRLENSQ